MILIFWYQISNEKLHHLSHVGSVINSPVRMRSVRIQSTGTDPIHRIQITQYLATSALTSLSITASTVSSAAQKKTQRLQIRSSQKLGFWFWTWKILETIQRITRHKTATNTRKSWNQNFFTIVTCRSGEQSHSGGCDQKEQQEEKNYHTVPAPAVRLIWLKVEKNLTN